MERRYNLVAIHSQSNRPDSPLGIEGHPEEQAYESRALCLALDAVGLSKPIEREYLIYFKNKLKQKTPEFVIPKKTDGPLSHSFVKDGEARDRLKKYFGKSGQRGVLSVFDPTENEKKMLEKFGQDGIPVEAEVDFDLAFRLGNKAGFREFCSKYDLPQVRGDVFDDEKKLESFVDSMREKGKKAVLKHPNGTAGEGLMITDNLDEGHSKAVSKWMSGAGCIVAEEFSQKGSEHSIHVYVDPLIKLPALSGIYDQLVVETDNGFAHYGCSYPVQNKMLLKRLENLTADKIIPALRDVNYTGPACFDVLADPDHFMELNTRAGANMYAHSIAKRISRSVYGMTEPGKAAFVFLAGLSHDKLSFEALVKHNEKLLEPKSDGMLIFSNPGRHEFGSYDVIAMSPKGLSAAEGILYDGLVGFWGKHEAQGFLDRIYRR